ncbi:MAG: HEAT repeat domain-containing protein [Planctomycetota bacterium]
MKLKIGIVGALVLTLLLTSLMPAGDVNWRKLQSELKSAVSSRNADAVKKAIIPIVNAGGDKAVDIVIDILERLPKSEDLIYWMLVNSITTITDPPGLDAMADYMTSKRNSLCKDLLFGLQTNRVIEVIPLLERVLLKCTPDMQKMAIEQLVNVGKEECVDALLSGLKSVRDRIIKDAVIEGLRILTGADAGDSYGDWKQYWEEAKNQPLPKEGEGEEGDYGGGFRTGLSRYQRKKKFGLEELGPLSCLVITSHCKERPGGKICFDHLENTLTQMQIKNTVVDRYMFDNTAYVIPKETIAIFINCTQIHPHCVCPHCGPGQGKANRLFP